MINELTQAAADVTTLDSFVDQNFESIFDYFTWETDASLSTDLLRIKEFITRNRIKLLQLPISDRNLAFLFLLLEVAERLGLSSQFRYLYDFLRQQGYLMPDRMEASARFLIGINTDSEFLKQYEFIYGVLQNSYEKADDDDKNLLTTLINYYLKSIDDFGMYNPDVARGVKKLIEKSLADNKFSFLNRPLIWDILAIELTDSYEAATHVRQQLDNFLERGIPEGDRVEGDLLEADTIYANELTNKAPTYENIRTLVKSLYRNCDGDQVFGSLGRGVNILTNECQLLGYIYSFGNMHYNKLIDACNYIPNEIISDSPNIIDWGCGQGIGTITLIECLRHKDIAVGTCQVLLIEPSIIALKRAALHVKNYAPESSISTINKDLDALAIADFRALKGNLHIHIFSNVLDMSFFSLENLIRLIGKRFSGTNYFVIVSPFKDGATKTKIDSFVNAFDACENFNLLNTVESVAGKWKGDWTRIQRVFTVKMA